MSRFEDELIKGLSEAPDDSSRALCGLRLAAYRARKGQTSSSRAIIDSIRAEFAATENPCLFARINFAESIYEFYTNGVKSAIQKLRRSQALLMACPSDQDLRWEVSAWMASYMRILRRWSDFERELKLILADLKTMPSSIFARIGLTIADSLQEIGDSSSADVWYGDSRAAALRCGDDAMFGAVLYNRVAIRVHNLRLSAIAGDSSDLSGCRVDLEAATAKNYSDYTNDMSMKGVFSLLHGQLAIMSEDFVLATQVLTDESVWSLVGEWPSVALILRADVLLGKRKLGIVSMPELREQAQALAKAFDESDMYGDVAIAANSLKLAILGADKELSTYLMRVIDASLVKFTAERVAQGTAMHSLGLCAKAAS